jgi:predicted transposase YbfD/YdcC
MDAQPTSLITRMFDDIAQADDPRASNARHFLTEILVIALLAVMSGVDDYPGVVEFGRDRLELLRTFLRLPHGIPSVSTFRRVFGALKPAVLNQVLRRWSGNLAGPLAGKQIAIDGKTLRRSFDHAWKKSGLHVVTAWCVQENLVLAQQGVDQKSNEITAVPELLKMLDLKGAVVTVDAMNTQKEIARQIVKGGGDYVMALKGNHSTLHDSVRLHMNELILEKFQDVGHVYHETTEAGHGRIDTRKVWATDQIDWLQGREQWKGLKSVVAVESIRRVIGQESPTVERRHFLASISCGEGAGRSSGGERLAGLVRNHWSIENGQHWTLDMGFDEDRSRIRKDHGQENMAIMRRLALGLLRRDKSVKVGARNKRLKAGRNPDYLFKVLLSPELAK